jgi:CcmD family protein
MDTIIEFLDKHSIYVVLIITLIIWIGLFTYIFKIDKKLKNFEKSE